MRRMIKNLFIANEFMKQRAKESEFAKIIGILTLTFVIAILTPIYHPSKRYLIGLYICFMCTHGVAELRRWLPGWISLILLIANSVAIYVWDYPKHLALFVVKHCDVKHYASYQVFYEEWWVYIKGYYTLWSIIIASYFAVIIILIWQELQFDKGDYWRKLHKPE